MFVIFIWWFPLSSGSQTVLIEPPTGRMDDLEGPESDRRQWQTTYWLQSSRGNRFHLLLYPLRVPPLLFLFLFLLGGILKRKRVEMSKTSDAPESHSPPYRFSICRTGISTGPATSFQLEWYDDIYDDMILHRHIIIVIVIFLVSALHRIWFIIAIRSLFYLILIEFDLLS